MSHVVIRPAAVTDFASIARLVSELGYATSPSQMQRRLEAIFDDHDYDTLVACEGEHIVGFVGTRSGPLYEADGKYGQIMALAVAASHHRRGVGQMLMQAAESKLAERGARELVVTSGNHREMRTVLRELRLHLPRAPVHEGVVWSPELVDELKAEKPRAVHSS